jgi:protein gp37
VGEVTNIGWVDGGSTFNMAIGCSKISPGCDHCYAEKTGKRFGTPWGPGVPRRYFSDKHWDEPLRWDRKAKAAGKNTLVFCSSLADVFDNEHAQSHRDRLWALIKTTPHLTWLILTKRVGNVPAMLPADWGDGYPNVWLGISVVNQEEADRDIPKLLRLKAVVRFLSIEPMLACMDISQHLSFGYCPEHDFDSGFCLERDHAGVHHIDWVIVGGESGSKARLFDLQWAEQIVAQCRDQEVPFFMKQLGANPVTFVSVDGEPRQVPYPIIDAKGAVMNDWPAELRIQQFPESYERAGT